MTALVAGRQPNLSDTRLACRKPFSSTRLPCIDHRHEDGLDRGLLEPGLKADVNVVDHANLRLRPPYMAYDLPADGKRLLQRAEGYLHTFVNGEEVYADGEPCGALPGRLVRGSGMPIGASTGA